MQLVFNVHFKRTHILTVRATAVQVSAEPGKKLFDKKTIREIRSRCSVEIQLGIFLSHFAERQTDRQTNKQH